MASDALDPPTPPAVVVARVAAGRYVLVVGDPAGNALKPTAGEAEPRPLAQAIAQARRERQRPLNAGTLTSTVEDASQVMDRAEHAVTLFAELAQGRLSAAAAGVQVDALLGLLGRLDRDDRWKDELRVARSLAMLLALLGRWLDLLQSLQVALGAAEKLTDVSGEAWALHELGTLHLAAEQHLEADRMLSRARDLRKSIGDQAGLEMTDYNLQTLCRTLRAELRPPGFPRDWIPRQPLPALVLGILLLGAGGVAGAAIRGSGRSATATTAATGKPSVRRVPTGQGATATSTPPSGPVTTAGVPGTPTATSTPSNGPVTPAGVPDAPTEVTAVHAAGIPSGVANRVIPSRDVVVRFVEPSSNGSSITRYTVTAAPVQRAEKGSGSPVVSNSSKSPITVEGLESEREYTFTVTASNAVGTGPPSVASNAIEVP